MRLRCHWNIAVRIRRVRALDKITMHEYMRQKGWDSERLDWFVNYGCRDDYACPIDEVSAWAGIHYYACRYYADQLQDRFPVHTVTWPEGNAFLVNGMARRFSSANVRLNALVLSIRQQGDEVLVTFMDTRTRQLTTWRGQTAIYAGQKHIANYIIPNLPDDQQTAFQECQYAPWLTGSIHLKRLPQTKQSPLAWDNVMYESEGLGYIVAEHQTRDAIDSEGPSVLTYYLPFDREPDIKRRELLDKGHDFWVNEIMKDLWEMHPGIEKDIARIDLYKWGHAMIRPTPNFIWGPDRGLRGRPFGKIFFGNADVTGCRFLRRRVIPVSVRRRGRWICCEFLMRIQFEGVFSESRYLRKGLLAEVIDDKHLSSKRNRNLQITTNFPNSPTCYFIMPRHLTIQLKSISFPNRVSTALSIEITIITSKMPQKITPFHSRIVIGSK